MDPVTSIALAIAGGLVQVGGKLLEKGIVEPALKPATKLLEKWVQRGHRRAEKDQALLKAVRSALEQAGAPTDDTDDLVRWLKRVGLNRLTAERNDALRRQVARGVLAFTGPQADPPRDLMEALGWPRGRKQELAALLAAIRAQLVALDDWQAPIAYADRAAQLGLLRDVLAHLAQLDNLVIHTETGKALLVAVVQAGLTAEETSAIESRYREDLVKELTWHDFRGIVQVKRTPRLPLADIYLELGLLSSQDEGERKRAQERLLALREEERLAEEERRLQERVTDALTRASRLVILGGPGSGKTISLRFITLMLAHGYGAARLGLDAPYVPLMIRLADYARELETDPALSLCNYLLDYTGKAYESHPRLPDFLRLALEKGTCMVLLDGLDEVGDDPVRGYSLRTEVVKKVQRFADRWCDDQRCNRLVVTSRIEGYWDEPVRGFAHAQLSPLRPPDEVEALLCRWYTAHELTYETDPALAERRARERVDGLLPQVLEWPSVRRLATNPLLLTILALIHENVGKLPNRRIELYEICAQTLIESWRQAQTGMPSALLAELGGKTMIRVMAPLAYWLHEKRPGGTASHEEWQEQLTGVLCQVGFEAEAHEITGRFLHHARHEAGLLAERGLGQFGFFHLTFEEYLAAREMARQRAEERRELLRAHWEDPRWHEVILLAAGQLGIVETRQDDASDFIEELLKREPQDPSNAGRQAVLAGRALADIGPRSVTNATRRWVLRALKETMQNQDPETGRPRPEPVEGPPRLSVRTRFDAGEVLDELGWLPDDLNGWVWIDSPSPTLPPRVEGEREGAGEGFYATKYPVTNTQYERFLLAGGYENPDWWSEQGWQWRTKTHPSYRGEGPVIEPGYWRGSRLGRERRGYPVVGVSWYEAQAFCRWLTGLLLRARAGEAGLPEDRALVADLLAAGAAEVRLPTEEEWAAMAGGVKDEGRYPWDPLAGPATRNAGAILARANTKEAELKGPTPVAMYPLGASHPFGLMDLAGNVWEWTSTTDGSLRVIRGGSWYWDQGVARCAYRYGGLPDLSSDLYGFRCVSPVSLF
ncbi:MAG: SUMF1/EgtB/PvdO family nonheme iron enzyme [Chloroflexota bacterium]|nr:SUMF1/EgtB/PvdO family nonheme iron enzyme [Chloroflexota bacterium]